MRILMLSDGWPPAGGGAERVAESLAWELAASGEEVTVVCCRQSEADHFGTSVAESGRLDVTAVRCGRGGFLRPARGIWNRVACADLASILRELRPDVVHAHNVHGGLSYRSLAVAGDWAPVIVTLHDLMPVAEGKIVPGSGDDASGFDPAAVRIPLTSGWSGKLRKLARGREIFLPFRPQIARRMLRRSASALVAVSSAHRDVLAANGLDGVEVIPNGLDADAWKASDRTCAALRSRLGLADHPVVLFGGRVSRLKGAEELLRALASIVAECPSATLVVAGHESAYTRRFAQRAREQGLGDNVRFAGWLTGDELVAAYGASDVVVVPSICFETFSMVTLEAMAARKPVVATCFGGPAELVVEGETGYLVNPRRIADLANAVVSLLVDRDAAARMGHAGYERLVAEFSLSRMRDRYRRLYLAACAKGADAGRDAGARPAGGRSEVGGVRR